MPVESSPATVTLRQLQYIVAVADLGGFGRAAVFCHVSQPSLSAQVALAEAQLGVQVFERSHHGVRPSAAGVAIIEQARRVLGAQQELETLARHLKDPFHGTLRIGVIPTIGPYLLPEIAPALDRAYPNLSLIWKEERTPSIVADLRDGGLDAGIVAVESHLPELVHADLLWDPFVLAISPEHPLARSRKPVPPSVLAGQSVLLLDDGHCFREQALGLCDQAGADEGRFRATSLSTLVQMIGSGASMTLLPTLALPVENRTNRLAIRPFTKPAPGRTLALAWRKGSALATALTAIAQTIRRAGRKGGVTAALLCLLAWPATAPAQVPRDTRFAEAVRRARQMPRLHSLLVSERGTLALEYYRTGVTPSRLANIKSASKSVISALVGIAIDRRLIPTPREPIATYFPELRRDTDARKAAITVEDLLTMRSGLETTSNRNYGAWVTSPNWVRFVLTRRLLTEPGTTMQYSTGSTHLLSSILSKVSGTSTWQFAQATLARPLGITLAQWPRDPQGVYFGGNDMLLTPRQMIAIGEMYLNEGRANGKQVVPAAWVRESCVPRTTSRFDAGREYGYGWWIDEVGAHRACYAWGYGGQYVLVFEELGIVVAATSSTATDDARRSYRRELLDLIGRMVLPAVTGDSHA